MNPILSVVFAEYAVDRASVAVGIPSEIEMMGYDGPVSGEAVLAAPRAKRTATAIAPPA
jgi:hypothetical protein